MADGDIIVVGQLRPQNPGYYVNYGNGLYGYRSTEPAVPVTGKPADSQPDDIVVIGRTADPAKAAKMQEAMDNVAKTIAFLTPIIRTLPDSKKYTLSTGQEVTGAEIKAIWAKMRFSITDQSFGPNRAGALTVQDGFIVDTLYYDDFEGPGSYADPNYPNDAGMNFIIMHEVMHMTVKASEYNNDMYASFRENVSNPTDARWYGNIGGWFGRSEKFTNTLSKVFGGQHGFTPLASPNFGYIAGNQLERRSGKPVPLLNSMGR